MNLKSMLSFSYCTTPGPYSVVSSIRKCKPEKQWDTHMVALLNLHNKSAEIYITWYFSK